MGSKGLTILFGLTIFVGAFLLFQIQPLIAKFILPWFGGSPTVWTTCMLFFQVGLLAGYGYAHAGAEYVSPRKQVWIHCALLIVAIVLLPIVPGARWMPVDSSNPTLRILGMLCVCVGGPYVMLAATGPMLQAWLSRVTGGKSPYRLYALSNVASMGALLSYPIWVEPNFTRTMQARMWGFGFVGFVVVCALTGIFSMRRQNPHPGPLPEYRAREKYGKYSRGLWLMLPACASTLLLAVTNKICQEIAVVPLLWVVPLAIYLLSFIICFDSPRWYVRGIFVPLMGVTLAIACAAMLVPDETIGVLGQIAIYCVMLFACCMVCHGELFRLRPDPAHLTSFYLMIAAGGAIGGILVAIIAPLVLSGYYELHAAMFVTALLAMITIGLPKNVLARGGVLIAFSWLIVLLGVNATGYLKNATVLAQSRNFYGVLKVYDIHPDDPTQHQHMLHHGGITHGLQFIDPSLRTLPTAYYHPGSGIGLALRTLPHDQPRKIGLVGLGIGTVLAYGETGDDIRVYELNDEVVRLAKEYFTYISDCKANVQIILGDGRLSLQREESQQFDVLILDAFNGDAIPVHLLTREAFEIYLRHVKPGGLIAVHISNQHLDLAPVVQKLAEHFNLKSAQIITPKNDELAQYEAHWMLLTTNDALIDSPAIRAASSPVRPNESIRLWTDEDTNLFQILN